MALLQDIKNRCIERSSDAIWQQMVKDFVEPLVFIALDDDNSFFTEALNLSKEVYGLSQSDVDYILSATAEVIIPQTVVDPISPAFYKAAGSVLSDGSLEQGAGGTVARLSVGRYEISFNSPANTATYPVLATMQGLPQNDDYQWAYLERTVDSFKIEVREQDNGGTAGVLRDSGFSFFVPII